MDDTRQLLRELFYHRHVIGTKVEEEIEQEDPALWRRCHAALNRPDAPPLTVLPVTVHHLHWGNAACRKVGPPANWPEWHLWSSDWQHVNCPDCITMKPQTP
jgi:hypothetical protein